MKSQEHKNEGHNAPTWQVPTDYFERLPGRVMARLEQAAPPQLWLPAKASRWALVASMLVGAWLLWPKPSEEINTPWST
ncbi:MAG: hypothetical protein HC842_07975, partial [Cytophagales bacterium]|nr:hypothetical protein [Cytophagales bacterium]